MRVLWFALTPGLSAEYLKISSTGGGWIASLQKVVEQVEECQLGFVFYTERASAPFDYGKTRYFPIRPLGSSKGKRLLNRITGRAEQDENLPAFLRAIDEFKPDIIHVHGTEYPFGLILREVKDIPVVVSIQGVLTVYREKYLAGLRLPGLWKGWRTGYAFHRADFKIWKKRMEIEQEILRRTPFVFGRTDWDRRIMRVLAPQAEYIHVDEVIRPGFYGLEWKRRHGKPAVFFTTSSHSIYKGFEVIIDTARILLRNGVEFEWLVAGLSEKQPLVLVTLKEKGVRNLAELKIRLLGTMKEDAVADRLLNCDAYIQVSHIENSPNSVCEAMLAGAPVIASFAGGTGSILKDGVSGTLVQDGDPFALAGAMEEVITQPEQYAMMAAEGRKVAQRRHDPRAIVNGMVGRYREIIQKQGS